MTDHYHHEPHPIQNVDDTKLGYYEALCWALRDELIDSGLITADGVRSALETMESKGVHLGAELVVNAWLDGDFKQSLLRNGKKAAAEVGVELSEADLVVVENTDNVHNLIVCTLCSCYPRSLLGQPPSWYVSKTYRSRAVRDPRGVLHEFGLNVPSEVQVRVHDSSADMRYMVLPKQPESTKNWPREKLKELITRDMLVGVAVVQPPIIPAE